MNGSPCHVRFGKIRRGIRLRSIHAQFVICLLVAAGVDGGPHLHTFGDDKNIFDPFAVKTERSAQTRCSGADDKSVYMTLFHSLAISIPPPMSITVPVE